MENKAEKEELVGIGYKIMPERKYRVFRKDYNGRTFYNIQITQKEIDGSTTKYYRPVTFKRGVEVENNTDIIIHKGLENLRHNSKDAYNPISAILILEFEEIKTNDQIEEEAFNQYQKDLDDLDNDELDKYELPF